jgi:predicted ATP-grasp superfamily ATP-dependent carboligase
MAYKRDQDIKSLKYKMERDRQSLQNTRLSLLNQSNVIHAITNLADAIRAISASTATTEDSQIRGPNRAANAPVEPTGNGPSSSTSDASNNLD